MNGWALTTAVVDMTPYYDAIYRPLTAPRFAAYAEKWGMRFSPSLVSPLSEFGNNSPAPYGTAADYATLPHRQRLMEDYEGVVFLDSDAVIVSDVEDICETVDDDQPIGSINGCGVVVMKSCELSKAFLDSMWAMRHHYATYQWLEQAAYCELVGYEGTYPGDGQEARWRGPTAWTRFTRELHPKWNWGPRAHQPLPDDLRIFHPFGVQPFEHRLQMIRETCERHPLGD